MFLLPRSKTFHHSKGPSEVPTRHYTWDFCLSLQLSQVNFTISRTIFMSFTSYSSWILYEFLLLRCSQRACALWSSSERLGTVRSPTQPWSSGKMPSRTPHRRWSWKRSPRLRRWDGIWWVVVYGFTVFFHVFLHMCLHFGLSFSLKKHAVHVKFLHVLFYLVFTFFKTV